MDKARDRVWFLFSFLFFVLVQLSSLFYFFRWALVGPRAFLGQLTALSAVRGIQIA